MRKLRKLIPLRIFNLVLILLLGFASFSVFAQKEILLYSSDFSDWGTVIEENAKEADYSTTGVGGDGFIIKQGSKPHLTPSINTLCYGSSSELTFRPFFFVSGGTVEFTFKLNKQGVSFDLSGATIVSSSIDNISPASTTPPISTVSGGTFSSGKNFGVYTVSFVISGSGFKTLKLTSPAKCGQIDFYSIKVYSGVGTTPYVVCTDYPQAPAKGLSLSAIVGGSSVSKSINIKAYNITADVQLSFSGNDAAKFLSTSLVIPKAVAMTGTSLPVSFTPSVKPSISNALLELTATGVANPYIISLIGLTSNAATPQLVADTATMAFWTSLIAPTTNTIDISGINLTGDVNVSITGANASQFTPSIISFTKEQALAGKKLSIKYTGDILVGEHNAILEISAAGATTIKIPLKAYTSQTKPIMYNLNFVVSPAGSGFVETSPHASSFKLGTKVVVNAIPETGYKLERWGDGKASNYTNRIMTVNDLNKGTITVYFTKGIPVPPVDPTTSFAAYVPTQINKNSFTAVWTPSVGATGYLVTVYNADNSIYKTISVTNPLKSSEDVLGLLEDTFYSYSVETIGLPQQKNTGVIGPFKTNSANTIKHKCGQ